MFDEFFYRRRKTNALFYTMIGFLILGIGLVGLGIWYIM